MNTRIKVWITPWSKADVKDAATTDLGNLAFSAHEHDMTGNGWILVGEMVGEIKFFDKPDISKQRAAAEAVVLAATEKLIAAQEALNKLVV